MRKMSRTQTRFYLGVMTMFFTPAELCRRLSITRPTMDRYLSGENLPSERMLPIFEEALKSVFDHLDDHHRQWGVGRQVADVLEELEPPRSFGEVIPTPPNAVKRFLSSVLEKPTRSTIIHSKAREVGFTRAQLIHAAKSLRVIKEQHGAGRGSFSIWRLP